MLFNSLEFIVFFIIVSSTIIVVKNRIFQHSFLLVASYFFFFYSSNYLLSLLIISTLLDYYVGKEIWKSESIRKKKFLLIASLAGNLGLLGFFKYADFGIEQLNNFANSLGLEGQIAFLSLALPIGISFYAFQTISYTVDIYRGKLTPCTSLREFAVFVSFFPQLVAGPILRAHQFLPQLRQKVENLQSQGNLRQIIIQNTNLKLGTTLVAFGFFKKMFFADNIAPLVNHIFNSPIGEESFTIILGAIAFGIQIYGDFSGYSDIAIGIALILGFKIPMNFNKPYFATSPSDFWRRWHISLSSWLRDYLYIPLGGNRKSKPRTYFNLATVMFLGGLWHGASWNFVIWGMLHGAYLAIHKAIQDKFPHLKNIKFFRTKLGVVFSIFLTQYLVFLAWIPFRVRDFEDLMYSIQKYIFLDFATEKTFQVILEYRFEVTLIVLFFILHFISYKKTNMPEKISKYPFISWGFIIFGIMVLILFFYDANPQDFIYFRF